MSTTELLIGVAAIAVMVIVASATAAAETALTRMSRARAESLAAADLPGSEALADLIAERQATLSPFLLIRLVCHLATATLVAVIVRDQTTTGWLWAAVAAEMAVMYVLAEAIPRTWALQHPDLAARRAAPVVRLVLRIAPLRWGHGWGFRMPAALGCWRNSTRPCCAAM